MVPLVRICSATSDSTVDVPTGSVATLQPFDGGDGRTRQRDRHTCAARPLGGGDDLAGPVLAIGHDGRQFELLDVAADRLGRLKRVDHRERPTGGEKSDDRGCVLQAIADHQTDRRIVGDAGIAQQPRDGVGVFGDVVAGVPAALELDARLLAVARQPCRELFGKPFGHA